MASIGIVGLIAIVAVAIVSIWVPLITACILIVAILALIGFVIRSIQQTLKDSPASPLEDQLYLEHRKLEMELAAKNYPIITIEAQPIADPNPAPKLIEEPEKLEEPEEED